MRVFPDRPTLDFYQPDADAVFLVVDGHATALPLQPAANGRWTLKLDDSLEALHGRSYHFVVHRGDALAAVADPCARHTERCDDRLVSRFDDSHYPWQDRFFRTPDLQDIVIYESHLPALSRHPSAPVDDEAHRGTYAGARAPAVLDHLQRLGVAVEFLPLHASDPVHGGDWGYFSTSYHAMRETYSHDRNHATREAKAVIDAMHQRGIPVILDVVFNHGGELWVKAWGEDVVYRRLDNGNFCQGSGCGPTIRTEHPHVREAIVDSLVYLVDEFHFDGFRFDLGALHDKETMLAIDRALPQRIHLFAEPWALGGTQWGKGDLADTFAQTRWAVWNDDFREPARAFLTGTGDQHNRDRLMRAIVGSHVADGGWAIRPQQCVNYLSCHDGHTLADLVGGDAQRAFLGMLLVLTAQGVPMLGEGSEMLYTKHGHENSYNRPDLNQLDWQLAEQHHDLVEAVGRLVAWRRHMPHFRYTGHVQARHPDQPEWDIDWIHPTGFPHHDNRNAIGYVLKPPANPHLAWAHLAWVQRRAPVIVLLNGSDTGCHFHLPEGSWKLVVDGHGLQVDEHGIPGVAHAHGDYHVHAGTGVVLVPV